MVLPSAGVSRFPKWWLVSERSQAVVVADHPSLTFITKSFPGPEHSPTLARRDVPGLTNMYDECVVRV